jgi:hypothetical protein
LVEICWPITERASVVKASPAHRQLQVPELRDDLAHDAVALHQLGLGLFPVGRDDQAGIELAGFSVGIQIKLSAIRSGRPVCLPE